MAGVARLFSFVALLVAEWSLVVGRAPADFEPHRVVVYYANEASAAAARSPNEIALLSALRKSNTPLAKQLIDSIAADQRFFPEIVRRDVRALQADAERDGFDLFVFTNELALRGGYLARAARGRPALQRWVLPPEPRDPVLDTSPLSRPDVLRAALSAVERRAPPGSDVIFIANSHGSDGMALMPRVNADMSIAKPADVLSELRAVDSATPIWAHLKGTTKVAFWQALAEADARGALRYALVFREACASGIASWDEYRAWPSDVALVADSGRANLDPSAIEVGADVDVPATDPAWSTAVASRLQRNGIAVETKRGAALGMLWLTLGSVPAAVYFVPLIAWVFWYVLTERVRRSRAS